MYTSPILDIGTETSWNIVEFSGFLRINTSLELRIRTSVDNVSWSSWSDPITELGDSTFDVPDGRYLQYRVNLSTNYKFLTPEIESITFLGKAAVISAHIYYTIDGVTWNTVPMLNTFSDQFTGTIPAISTTSDVDFYIIATDSLGVWDDSSMFSYVSDGTAPLFGTPTISPEHPDKDDDVEVSIEITDNVGVDPDNVELSYSYDGITWYTIQATLSAGFYRATITGPGFNKKVDYYFLASDLSGNLGTSISFEYWADGVDPVITNVTTFGIESSQSSFTVSASVTDNLQLSDATLYWSLDNSTWTEVSMPLLRVLYLVGGRTDYNLDSRLSAMGWDVTRLQFNQEGASTILDELSHYDLVILDGVNSGSNFDISSSYIQNKIISYVNSGGMFYVLCPSVDIWLFGTHHPSGWRNNNVVEVDGTHPITHIPSTGNINNWDASETNGYFTSWADDNFSMIYADSSDTTNSGVMIWKEMGDGLLILTAQEMGYPGNAPESDWLANNMVHYAESRFTTEKVYEGIIPATGATETVYYYVEATDQAGNSNSSAVLTYETTTHPELSLVSISPKYPNAIDNVTVQAEITDDYSITEVTLTYANSIGRIALVNSESQSSSKPYIDAAGIDYELFGTGSGTQPVSNLYNNIDSYNIIIFSAGVGRDSTITGFTDDSTSKQTLKDWVKAGGLLYIGMWDNSGNVEEELFNPYGFAIGSNDDNSGSGGTVLAPTHPVVTTPNNLTYVLNRPQAVEEATSLPSGHNGIVRNNENGALTMSTFDYGTGHVFWTALYVDNIWYSSYWDGFEQHVSGSGKKYWQNVITYLYSQASPKNTTTIIMNSSGSNYTVTIPAMLVNMPVYFFINATDNHGYYTRSSVITYIADGEAPNFGIPTLNPGAPNASVDVNVSCEITDNVGVNASNVTLHYKYNGLSWNTISMANSSGDTYKATIPAPNSTTWVYYYLTASDISGGNSATSDTYNYSADSTLPVVISLEDLGNFSAAEVAVVQLEASDNAALGIPVLYYKIGMETDWNNVAMVQISGNVSYGTFEASIPAIQHTLQVQYYAFVPDAAGNSVTTTTIVAFSNLPASFTNLTDYDSGNDTIVQVTISDVDIHQTSKADFNSGTPTNISITGDGALILGSSHTTNALLQKGYQSSNDPFYNPTNFVGQRAFTDDLNTDWSDYAPLGLTSSDYFSVTWEGEIYIATAGLYSFDGHADDRSQILIDNTYYSGRAWDTYLNNIWLDEGWHAIKLGMTEFGGNQWAYYRYQGPGISHQIIPMSVLRMPSYDLNGLFVSEILDAGSSVFWSGVDWSSSVPSDTSMAVQVRTSSDGSNWSSWSVNMTKPGDLDIPDGRYVQYRIWMETTDDTKSPKLFDITLFAHTGVTAVLYFSQDRDTWLSLPMSNVNATYKVTIPDIAGETWFYRIEAEDTNGLISSIKGKTGPSDVALVVSSIYSLTNRESKVISLLKDEYYTVHIIGESDGTESILSNYDIIVITDNGRISSSTANALIDTHGKAVVLLYNAGRIFGGSWASSTDYRYRQMYAESGSAFLAGYGGYSLGYIQDEGSAEREYGGISGWTNIARNYYSGNYKTAMYRTSGAGGKGAMFTYDPYYYNGAGEDIFNRLIWWATGMPEHSVITVPDGNIAFIISSTDYQTPTLTSREDAFRIMLLDYGYTNITYVSYKMASRTDFSAAHIVVCVEYNSNYNFGSTVYNNIILEGGSLLLLYAGGIPFGGSWGSSDHYQYRQFYVESGTAFLEGWGGYSMGYIQGSNLAYRENGGISGWTNIGRNYYTGGYKTAMYKDTGFSRSVIFTYNPQYFNNFGNEVFSRIIKYLEYQPMPHVVLPECEIGFIIQSTDYETPILTTRETWIRDYFISLGFTNFSYVSFKEARRANFSAVELFVVVSETNSNYWIEGSVYDNILSKGIGLLLLYGAGRIYGGSWGSSDHYQYRQLYVESGTAFLEGWGGFSMGYVQSGSAYRENGGISGWTNIGRNYYTGGYKTAMHKVHGSGAKGVMFTYDPLYLYDLGKDVFDTALITILPH
jgi:hypothetical protein